MSRSTLPIVHRSALVVPKVEEDAGNSESAAHYSSPTVPARPCPPRPSAPSVTPPPVPAVRKRRGEQQFSQTLPRSPSTASSSSQALAPAIPQTVSRAVQSAVDLSAAKDDFGTCLQSARDCINKRHEDELKALEGFRAYIHRRAKADAEYAATLGKIGSQASRETASLSASSNIVQVWKMVLVCMYMWFYFILEF